MTLSELENDATVKILNYEKILADTKSTLIKHIHSEYPEFDFRSESDPLLKTIEIAAYRELLIRQKIKNTLKMSLLSQSTGPYLHQLAHLILGDTKIANNDVYIKESIDELWYHTPYYTTGTKSAYLYFTKQVDAKKIRDVHVIKKENSQITIYILLHENYHRLSVEEKDKLKEDITKKVTDENIRRITDKITVEFVKIKYYTIKATMLLTKNYNLVDIQQIIQYELKEITYKLFYIAQSISQNPLLKAFYKKGVEFVILELIPLFPANSKPVKTIQASDDEAWSWDGQIDFQVNKE